MDHDEVVRQKLTERYLLHELDGEARDAFEEHYFECSECAIDVRAGSEFVENSKIILALPSKAPSTARRAPDKPVRHGWFGHRLVWTRPVRVAASWICCGSTGSSDSGCWLSESGYVTQAARRAAPPANTSVGCGGRRDLGLVRAHNPGRAGERLPAVCQDSARRDLYPLYCGLV